MDRLNKACTLVDEIVGLNQGPVSREILHLRL